MKGIRTYFTDSGVEVTKRIKEGLTQLILGTDVETEINTYDKAKAKCSYYYPVYSLCPKTSRRVQVGFGIPK